MVLRKELKKVKRGTRDDREEFQRQISELASYLQQCTQSHQANAVRALAPTVTDCTKAEKKKRGMWITVFSWTTRKFRVGTTVDYMVPKVATPAMPVPKGYAWGFQKGCYI